MSEACPLDLNYGHLGTPIYDSEKHEWQFPRFPAITRQIKPIGKATAVLAPGLQHTVGGIQNAAERLGNIKGLAKAYPELQPASSLLPGLALVSEAVNEVISSHDPLVTDLLSYGQVHYSNRHGSKKPVPILAAAGGPAGETVRLVRLRREHLKWEGDKSVYLQNFYINVTEESFWTGTSSPIQQLTFAESRGRDGAFLAVRYHGAISILHPRLKQGPPFSISMPADSLTPDLDPNPLLRLDMKRSRSVPFSDVAFNPWNNQQFATIDQDGYWVIWNIKAIARIRGLWTTEKAFEGCILNGHEDEEISPTSEDGWGTVLWAGTSTKLIVAGRRTLAIFDVRNKVIKLSVPDILSKKPTDWMLDIKRKPSDHRYVFIVTSSTLFCMRIASSNDLSELGAQCLLSWKHFLNPGNISLRLNVLDTPNFNDISDATATTLLLYSRSNAFNIVFTLQTPKSPTDQATSTSDPFLFLVNKDRQTRIQNIQLEAIEYGFDRAKCPGLGHHYFEQGVKFYRVRVLRDDLSLSESLYAESSKGSALEIYPPNICSRKDIFKTPPFVLDNFVVPDNFEDDEFDASDAAEEVEQLQDQESGSNPAMVDDENRSINFKWLKREIRRIISGSGAKGAEEFEDILKQLFDKTTAETVVDEPTMETLLTLATADFSIVHPDEAALHLRYFLKHAARRRSTDDDPDAGERLEISNILTPRMSNALGLENHLQMLDLYDSLLESWIKDLSPKIPSRTRISMERLLRNIVGQLCLASFVAYRNPTRDDEDMTQGRIMDAGAQLVLPVRGKGSAAPREKGKQPATTRSSPQPSSSMSEDVGFLTPSPFRALPTPEPTPSLHSQSSATSFVEDPSIQHLRKYAKLITQSAFPIKHANVHGHWLHGANPANYSWEAAEEAFLRDDGEPLEARSKRQKRHAKLQKRPEESTAGLLSRPILERLGGSQPQQRENTQGSSQAQESRGVASPGKIKIPRLPGFK